MTHKIKIMKTKISQRYFFAQLLAKRTIILETGCVNYSKSITLTSIQLITTTAVISTFSLQHPAQRKPTHSIRNMAWIGLESDLA